MGLDNDLGISQQSPTMIEIWKALNRNIPPNEALLSYRSLLIQNNPAKGSHYRPEVAWYLDRETVPATTLPDIARLASSGRFRYYLVDMSPQTIGVYDELMTKYRYEYFKGHPVQREPERVPMNDQLVFDLRTRGL